MILSAYFGFLFSAMLVAQSPAVSSTSA